jgi:hypothetical protein
VLQGVLSIAPTRAQGAAPAHETAGPGGGGRGVNANLQLLNRKLKSNIHIHIETVVLVSTFYNSYFTGSVFTLETLQFRDCEHVIFESNIR